jgi:hypothetical protein
MSVRDADLNWHFWTYGVGTTEEMSKFIANIKISNPDAIDEFCCKTSIISIDSCVDDVLANEEAFIVHNSVIERIRKNDMICCEVTLTAI